MLHLPPQKTSALTVLLYALAHFMGLAQVSYQDAFPNLSFSFPVELQNADDGTNRFFVVEQPGLIKVFPNSSGTTAGEVRTFLDLTQTVAYSSGQEIGLLGMAFHPQFATNGHVFVYYIDRPSNYRINIVRYTVAASNPNALDATSALVIARYMKNQGDSNHNGGKIAFGPDGYLYASIGDGGGGGDPQRNGQNLNTVFGSIIRLDVDLNGDNPLESNPELPNGNYEIPSDNPRVGQQGLDELYAWGIRNTWKFSFDAQGRLWGADVGQNAFEEINLIENGGNYGWNRFEANTQPSYGQGTTLATTPDLRPIFAYGHAQGDVSITGGYVYRGSLTNGNLRGNYIYGDYVSGRVWALAWDAATGNTTNTLLFKTNGQFISSFGEDEAGELYFSNYGNNVKIYRLTETVTGPETRPVNGVGEWAALEGGANGMVSAVCEGNDGTLYVGGDFTAVNGIAASNLARRVADTWQAWGVGANGPVWALTEGPNGTLYAAGNFTQIGGVAANHIAAWDGSAWSALGSGTNGPVAALGVDGNGRLYAGGVFSSAGGLTTNNIAVWSNGAWSGLSDGSTGAVGTNNEIRSIAIDQNDRVYVGGNFDTAGGVPAARIARWNGTQWSALGEGTSGFVQAIAIVDNWLYAGGNFAVAGGQTANRTARFDLQNGTWQPLDQGVSGNVNSLRAQDGFLYAAGSFETASDQENINKIVNNVARWSENGGWEAMGPNTTVGVNGRANALAFIKNGRELLVGGGFSNAGNRAAANIAVWARAFCTAGSLIPEYRVNGIWQSGSATLSVEAGDTVVLSLLPNTLNFTITLPGGSIVNGDHNLGAVTTAQAGNYLFTTADGCTLTLELQVRDSGNGQADTDGDGVVNANDACPNTPAGHFVDTTGCSATSFPPEQFVWQAEGISCNGQTDGALTITAARAGDFEANLTGNGQDTILAFSDTMVFDGLPPGEYELCIVSRQQAGLQQCSTIAVQNAPTLDVSTTVDMVGNTVSLDIKGNAPFTITLNNKQTESATNTVTLPLDQEVNQLSVTSSAPCEVPFEQVLLLENTILTYPNPFTNVLNVELDALQEEDSEVLLYDIMGRLLQRLLHTKGDGVLTIPTEGLRTGLYFLHVRTKELHRTVKVIRQ